jgi:DNA-directed RNA polymerase specialized sigma24 family protein
VLSPLRKKNAKTGELYRRFESVESVLKQLLALPREAVVQKCEIDDESNVNFVPSECLVHLVRICRNERPTSYFERLYGALMKRILLRLPPAESKDRKRLYLKESRIQEGVIDSFQEILALDRSMYDERLDFWEVAFGRALKKLTVTIQDKVWRDTNRSKPLEHAETGEILAHVVEAAGTSDPFGAEELFGKNYREQLPAAIGSLAPDKRRIIKMCLEGFPIDSIDPNVVTISKALNLSEKTVRTKRKQALAALKKFLEKGDKQ